MEINWTNCTEKLPPDDLNFNVIYHFSEPRYNKGSGHTLHFCIKEFSDPDKLKSLLMWTEFTKEKWEELNK